jgi:hypothetical protein
MIINNDSKLWIYSEQENTSLEVHAEINVPISETEAQEESMCEGNRIHAAFIQEISLRNQQN